MIIIKGTQDEIDTVKTMLNAMIADQSNFKVTTEIPEALNTATIKRLEAYFEQTAKYGSIKLD